MNYWDQQPDDPSGDKFAAKAAAVVLVLLFLGILAFIAIRAISLMP